MDWVQDRRRHHYDDPGPGAGPLSRCPPGSEMRVRVELAGVVFYAQTRQWTQDRVCITWHDDSYSYRTAWVPATAVRVVAYEEYLAAESARFQRAARLPAAD